MENKTKDNLIYLGVAGTIAAALALYVFYTDRTMGRIPKIPGPLLWGILSTPGIVALILERFWKHRNRRALWVILIIAATINVSAMVAAYSWQWNPHVILWSTLTALWVASYSSWLTSSYPGNAVIERVPGSFVLGPRCRLIATRCFNCKHLAGGPALRL